MIFTRLYIYFVIIPTGIKDKLVQCFLQGSEEELSSFSTQQQITCFPEAPPPAVYSTCINI